VDAISSIGSLGDLKKNEGAKWSDFPWNTHTDEKGQVFVSIPSKEPSKEETPYVGYLLAICHTAGFKLVQCSNPSSKDTLYDSIFLIGENLKGALLSLKLNELKISDNVPKANRIGFEFVMWYMLEKHATDINHLDFITIPRVVTLSPGQETAWKKSGRLAEVSKINQIVRLAARSVPNSLVAPSSFVKSLNWLKGKIVGKKPISGLFTEGELEYEQKAWAQRNLSLEKAYASLPKSWKEVSSLTPLSQYLDTLLVRRDEQSKLIEETVAKRVPQLVMFSGNARNKTQTIAPGGSLSEKILALPNPQIRAVANILWSPLNRLSREEWNSAVFSIVRQYLNGEIDINSIIENYVHRLENQNDPLGMKLRRAIADISLCSSLYLQIGETQKGNPVWDSFLGNR